MVGVVHVFNKNIRWPLTALSSMTSNIIKKNRTDHSCGNGINVTAVGYATNANPGPVIGFCFISILHRLQHYFSYIYAFRGQVTSPSWSIYPLASESNIIPHS